MKTLVYAGPGKVEVQEKPFPELRRITVVYAVLTSGFFQENIPGQRHRLYWGMNLSAS